MSIEYVLKWQVFYTPLKCFLGKYNFSILVSIWTVHVTDVVPLPTKFFWALFSIFYKAVIKIIQFMRVQYKFG